MGEVARTGIVHGRRVAVERLLPRSAGLIEPFVEKCLRELGCSSLVEPLIEGRSLTADQMILLLQDAPIAVLTKLVESLVGVSDSLQLPRPLVVLPFQTWTRESSYQDATDTALRFLRSVPFSELDVVIDWIDFTKIDRLLEVIEYLARRRPGARFIGPSIEEMVAWILQRDSLEFSTAIQQCEGEFEDLLYALRNAGFYRLRFASSIEYVRQLDVTARLRDAGFVTVLGIPIDRAGGIEALVHDLTQISSDPSGVGDWDVWLPSITPQSEGISQKDAVLDVRLLRLLAVGTLCLRHIPVRRASSGFLSLEGMSMARYFGANDLGYGALDAGTLSTLKLLPYRTLMQELSR